MLSQTYTSILLGCVLARCIRAELNPTLYFHTNFSGLDAKLTQFNIGFQQCVANLNVSQEMYNVMTYRRHYRLCQVYDNRNGVGNGDINTRTPGVVMMHTYSIGKRLFVRCFW